MEEEEEEVEVGEEVVADVSTVESLDTSPGNASTEIIILMILL